MGTALHHMLAYWDTFQHPAGLDGLGGQQGGKLVTSVQLEKASGKLVVGRGGRVSIVRHNVGSDFSVIISVISSIIFNWTPLTS